MRIGTNTTALNVWTSYSKNLSNMQSAMSKLSTGEIANTDDPAGIGISERMKAQIKSINMAKDNTDNATSMLQTADAWLQKINDELSRMKELSVEAQSGTMSSDDVSNIQTEFKAMQDEITRVTSKYTAAGKYNGIYLFRGGNGIAGATGDTVGTDSLSVQVGSDVNQTISLSLSNLEVTNTEVIGTVSTYSYDPTTNAVSGSSHGTVTWSSIIDTNKMSVSDSEVSGKLDLAIAYVAKARASVAAQENRLSQTSDGLSQYSDNISAAESKIRDVDMASETTQYSKYQVLTNAATSMLAQANSLPSSTVQTLLG
jgi:flagellin